MTSRSQVYLKVLGAMAVGVLVTAAAFCSRAHAQQTGITPSSGPPLQRPRGDPVTTDPFGMADSLQQPPRAGPVATAPQAGGFPADPMLAGETVVTKTDYDPRKSAIRKLDELRKQLRTAKSAERKDQIKTSVREALTEWFDFDMRKRRGELDRLTKRSDDMAVLLTKRAAAKDQLVDLQLKAFKYEAEGLGLFSERRTDLRIPAGVSGRVWAAGMYGGASMTDGTAGMMSRRGTERWTIGDEEWDTGMGEIDALTAALARVNWEARSKLRGAESEEDRLEALTELREALGEYFDRDMEFRQKELDQVKKGLVDMSDRLQRRANAKDEIVDLQLQMIVNEAEGLGFFSGPDAGNILPSLTSGGWSNAAPVAGAGTKPSSWHIMTTKPPRTRPSAPVVGKPSRTPVWEYAEEPASSTQPAAPGAADKPPATANLKQIGAAMHQYHQVNRRFPPAVLHGPDGKTPYSWRVALLPLLGQKALHDRYRFDEPWDGPNNRQLLDEMPAVYRCPRDKDDSNNTSYFVITGPRTVFTGDEGCRIRDFRDGTSNTLLVVEAKRSTPWTKPEDLVYNPKGPLPKLGGFFPGGFYTVLADGRPKFMSDSLDEDTLRALIMKDDGGSVADAFPPAN